jgi:hypothetical protein
MTGLLFLSTMPGSENMQPQPIGVAGARQQTEQTGLTITASTAAWFHRISFNTWLLFRSLETQMTFQELVTGIK